MTTPPTSKPPIVLLHGVGLDHTMWEPVAGLLDDGFRVITPDLPGHGTEDRVARPVSLEDLAAAVAEEVPAAAHLVGFSLGALVAQHLAVHRPDLVATLTSVSSVYRRTPKEREAVLARMRTAEADFAASAAASIRRWYDGTDVAHGWVERTRATLLRNDVPSFLHCYRVFATADAEVAPRLPDIAVPSLAVTGAEDAGSTPAMTQRLAETIPGCRAVIVPGARHLLPVQCPDVLADCLTTFLGETAHV